MVYLFGEVFDVKTIAKNIATIFGATALLVAPIVICALAIWALW